MSCERLTPQHLSLAHKQTCSTLTCRKEKNRFFSVACEVADRVYVFFYSRCASLCATLVRLFVLCSLFLFYLRKTDALTLTLSHVRWLAKAGRRGGERPCAAADEFSPTNVFFVLFSKLLPHLCTLSGNDTHTTALVRGKTKRKTQERENRGEEVRDTHQKIITTDKSLFSSFL